VSYLVLARKWRPQTFAEVIGQEHITGTLKKAVEKGRIAHAYLFAGPRGCGKTTTARLLAKIINCEKPNGAEPCNECASCTAITEGRHLDVIEIDGASNRGIDEIRDLREKIGYAPAQGPSKIYIIDEVHMLTPQAFNALLKTLEEPPAHVYLVFATTEPHKVPATILSRCQRYNFKRLELREIVSQLEKICSLEKIAFDRDALLLIARRAEGSMRDGESLLDQCLAASDGAVDLDLVRRVLGLVDSQLIMELLTAIAARDRRTTLAIVDRAVDSGLDLEEFFLAYIEGLRNLLVLSVEGGSASEFLDLSKSEIEELSTIAQAFKTENLLYLFRAAARSYRELKSSGQPRFQLEAALAEAASWESAVELSELIRRLDSFGGSGASPGGPVERKTDRGTSRPAGAEPHRAEPSEPSRAASFETHRAESLETARRASSEPSRGAADAGESAPAPGGPKAEAAFIAGVPEPVPPRETAGAFARVDQAAMSAIRTPEEENVLRAIGGREAWERFISQIRETKLTLGIWLVEARVASIAGDVITLSFAPQRRFYREMISEEKNRRLIEYHLERFFGRRLAVETAEHSDTPAAKQGPAAGISDAANGRPDSSGAGRDSGDTARRRSGEPKKSQAFDPALNAIAGEDPVIKRLIEEVDGELFKEGS